MYFLGIDLGSSSVKLALVETKTGKSLGHVQEPEIEMAMHAPQTGWAEQDPEDWWRHICNGITKIKSQLAISVDEITGIGIAYQMHGLVLVDTDGNVLRNAIIWCDSRAVAFGNSAFEALGKGYCEASLLNSPGNFTASKLKWVKDNEPETYAKIHKVLLPGDYIAAKFSGEFNTTISGLSEGIFWDFKADALSKKLLDYYGIEERLLPEIVDTFSEQALVSQEMANEVGLAAGTPILYRAGDQPNNALSLNVFNPGEIAATGGTSGVLYAITANLSATECELVNNFAHVTYQKNSSKNIGKLLCINGAGILYRWLLNNLAVKSYDEMNQLALEIPVGSDGVGLLPFGNGAERMLHNNTVGTRILNLDLNRHDKRHLCRAALEGIAFAFYYGFEIMLKDGVEPSVIRAGNDNLFRSEIFGQTLANLIQQEIEIYNTTGAIGAARACILKDGDFEKFTSFLKNDYVMSYKPEPENSSYIQAYNNWKKELELTLNK